MVNHLGTRKMGERLSEEYAQSLEGVSEKHCRIVKGIEARQCDALRKALGKGREAELTPEKIEDLLMTGLSRELLEPLAGKKALRRRAEVLAGFIPYRWWRFRGEKSPEERLQIARELGEMGVDARGALPALNDHLKDCYRIAGFQRAYLSGMAYPAARPTKDHLEDLRVCAATTATLGRLGDAALPALQRALREGSIEMQRSAAAVFLHRGQYSRELVAVLAKEVMDTERPPSERKAALMALGVIGRRAKTPALRHAALDMLIATLQREDSPALRGIAAFTLGSLDAEAAVQALRPVFLGEPDNSVVHDAAFSALVEIARRGGAAAIAVLEEGVNHLTSEATRTMAINGLGDIGDEAIPALVRASKSHRPTVRRSATRILSTKHTKETVAALEAISTLDDDATCRAIARQALRVRADAAGQPASQPAGAPAPR